MRLTARWGSTQCVGGALLTVWWDSTQCVVGQYSLRGGTAPSLGRFVERTQQVPRFRLVELTDFHRHVDGRARGLRELLTQLVFHCNAKKQTPEINTVCMFGHDPQKQRQ